MKRAISFLLAGLTLTTMMASCGSKGEGTAENTNVATASQTEEEKPKGYAYYEGQNLNGKTFTFLNAPANLWNMYTSITVDELTGETVNDAVFERNSFVMEKLNCKITEAEDGYTVNDSTLVDKLTAAVVAGDDCYDVSCVPYYQSANGIQLGYYYCLDDISTLHLDEEWWNQTLLAESSLNHRHYLANGPIHLMSVDGMWCLFFNEELMEDYGLTLPYDLVREGKWTVDEYEKYIKAGTQINGGTNFDYAENPKCVYGISSSNTVHDRFLYGFEAHFIEKTADDKMVFTADSEHFITAYQKMASIHGVTGQCLIANTSALPYTYKSVFKEGHALFMGGELKEAAANRDMDDDFGVVPYPKWTEEQESYHTTLVRKCCAIEIPITQKDPEGTGLLLDALSYESNERVLDLFLGNRVEQKGLRNEASVEMLHLMQSTIGLDLGAAYYLAGSLWSYVSTNIPAGNMDIASAVASYKDGILADMDTLLKAYK